MKRNYLQEMSDVENLLEKFKKGITKQYFTHQKGSSLKSKVDSQDSFYCWQPYYRQSFDIIKIITQICDFLDIKQLETKSEKLKKMTHFLETPLVIEKRRDFLLLVEEIQKIFSKAKEKVKEKISLLHDTEIDRLNEAIHCFSEGCYYSAVAMSVSAIEYRLLSLMMSTCSELKLKELTLGQLIREYLDDKKKYGNVIPKKHEPLLNHCNTYRIFSVHPKKEKINKPVASSILNMTFLFLLDKKLKREIKEEGK